MKCQGFSYTSSSPPFLPMLFQRGESLRPREKGSVSFIPFIREESMPEYQQHLATLSPRALTMLLLEGRIWEMDKILQPLAIRLLTDESNHPPPQVFETTKMTFATIRPMAVLFLLDGRMKVGDMRVFLQPHLSPALPE